jgi:ATP-dependent Clp protease ATP-binding subunit ClpX
MEGAVVRLVPRGWGASHRRGLLEVDTRQILFICGGAFEGLAQLVERRRHRHGIGFTASMSSARQCPNPLAHAEAHDLVSYGMIPEFVGRLPVSAVLDPLDEGVLMRILTEPANALVRQYKRLFAMEGCELRFTREALRAVAQEALMRGTGARGLRTVVERVLLEPMYWIPQRREAQCLTIDESTVRTGSSRSDSIDEQYCRAMQV